MKPLFPIFPICLLLRGPRRMWRSDVMVLRILRFQLCPLSLQLSTAASTANLLPFFFPRWNLNWKALDWKTPNIIQDIGLFLGEAIFFPLPSALKCHLWSLDIFCSCGKKCKEKKTKHFIYFNVYCSIDWILMLSSRQHLSLLMVNTPSHHCCCIRPSCLRSCNC